MLPLTVRRPIPGRTALLMALMAWTASVSAQTLVPASRSQWGGFYVGINAGGIWSSTCSTWTFQNDAVANYDYTGKCPHYSNVLVGGQLGYNFQFDNDAVFSLEADFDDAQGKVKGRTYAYPGSDTSPGGIGPGTFDFYGKTTPNGLGSIRFRLAHVLDHWLPYLTAGVAFAGGAGNGSASFTPLDGPTATWAGGKTWSSNGWTGGFGTEYRVANAWSLKIEYLHYSFGKGNTQVASCTTPAGSSTCEEFAGTSFFSNPNRATFNTLKAGINFHFGSLGH